MNILFNDCSEHSLSVSTVLIALHLIDNAIVKAEQIKYFTPEPIGKAIEAAYLFAATQGTMTITTIVKVVCDQCRPGIK